MNAQDMINAVVNGADPQQVVEGASSPHAACVKRLNLLLGKMVKDSMLIGIHDPIQLDAYCPEPDLVLLHPRADLYADAHPVASDVLLVIEIAATPGTYNRKKMQSAVLRPS